MDNFWNRLFCKLFRYRQNRLWELNHQVPGGTIFTSWVIHFQFRFLQFLSSCNLAPWVIVRHRGPRWTSVGQEALLHGYLWLANVGTGWRRQMGLELQPWSRPVICRWCRCSTRTYNSSFNNSSPLQKHHNTEAPQITRHHSDEPQQQRGTTHNDALQSRGASSKWTSHHSHHEPVTIYWWLVIFNDEWLRIGELLMIN